MPRFTVTRLVVGLTDLSLVLLSFLIAFALRLGWGAARGQIVQHQIILALVVILASFIYFGCGLYETQRLRLMTLVRASVGANVMLLLAALAIAFWMRGFGFPRSVLVLAHVLNAVLFLSWRYAVWWLVRAGAGVKRVLVAAEGDEAVHICWKFSREPHGWFELVGVSSPTNLTSGGAAVLADADLLVIGDSVPRNLRAGLIKAAHQVRVGVQIVPDLGDLLMVDADHNTIDDLSVLEVRPLCLSPQGVLAKRAFDLAVAVPLVLLLSPVLLLVWLAIRFTSPGSPIFIQERVGKAGRTFSLVKFRTMVADAEKMTGPVMATANDARITRLGRFLRATRLDELPQLWNVLLGDMSLVGPRPERPFFVDQYARQMPDYGLRHIVAPGVTGMAQVMGRYGTSVQDKLRFDLSYIRHYSIWLDVKILLLTVRTVLLAESAKGVESVELKRISSAQVGRAFTSD